MKFKLCRHPLPGRAHALFAAEAGCPEAAFILAITASTMALSASSIAATAIWVALDAYLSDRSAYLESSVACLFAFHSAILSSVTFFFSSNQVFTCACDA